MRIAIGLLLGVLRGWRRRCFPAAISTWCAVALLAGRPVRAMLTMTAANAGYHVHADVTGAGAGAAYLP